MISQADILKTLINNNCTDESVMSMALSPDCTPPKLMEKLTEAERFDLALDISMKLGLDVIPLWRTWAMRCLKNHNFQGARDKFRHCFLRLRMPGGRASPMQSNLLSDILAELTHLDETKTPLSEEIELIRRRKNLADSFQDRNSDQISTASYDKPSIVEKPKIYAECIHYLMDYGSVQDRVRFYVKNFLWDEAIKVLLEKSSSINVEKFFIGEVLVFSCSIGHLKDLIAAFLQADPNFDSTAKYFKAIYSFCLRNRRYNVLYYIQTYIGDHIAAASTQINFFFLKKPASSYRELNHRISSLVSARKNYLDYIEVIKNVKPTSSSLLTQMSEKEVKDQIRLIDLQLDITRNFAINEVSGCVNNIELINTTSPKDKIAPPNEFPVTLFEQDRHRKTFLVALVLIYFDLSCSSNFSKDGLDLANQLMETYDLNKLEVFKTAMRIIIDDESCDILENASLLLKRIEEDFMANHNKKEKILAIKKRAPQRGNLSGDRVKSLSSSKFQPLTETSGLSLTPTKQPETPESQIRAICDEVIKDSIGVCSEPDYKMELAKLLSGEAKIQLYIEHGKLSNAQRLACNMNRPDYVTSIIEEASKLNQNHVKTVCQLWLAKHETKNVMR